MGYAGYSDYAAGFGQGLEGACLSDTVVNGESGAYEAYGAEVDDVFIIDGQGQVRYEFSVAALSLSRTENRTTVDGWVRSLL